MTQVFDPLNLLILAIAVVLFFKLRSVLGTRTGTEKPPFDPFSANRRKETTGSEAKGGDNVVTMPRTNGHAAPAEAAAPVWQGYAEEGSALATGLAKIAGADRTFLPKSFLDGAKLAYEMIVTAFASGDRNSLKPLLSRDVYDRFAGAIDQREKATQRMDFRFVGVDRAEITDAELSGKNARVTVRFVGQAISALYSKSGDLVDGDPAEINEKLDLWTFEKDVTARDPNWKLVTTGDAA